MEISKKDLKKLSPYIWEIPKKFDSQMKVRAYILASEKIMETVFSDRSLAQLINTAKLEGVYDSVWAMPDIHEGYGAPIGGVIPMDAKKGLISPGAIGYDILCGMRIFKVPIFEKEIIDQMPYLMDQIFQVVPSGLGRGGEFELSFKELDLVLKKGAQWAVKKGFLEDEDLSKIEFNGSLEGDSRAVSQRAKARGRNQLGTLGSGNHFLEIQKVEKILQPNIAEKLGLQNQQVLVMIHSGSRGLGHQVASDYVAMFHRLYPQYNIKLPDPELAALPVSSAEAKQYLGAMRAAGNFAFANRSAIAYLVAQVFKQIFNKQIELIYDTGHNIAYEDSIKGKNLIIHRKGAGRAIKDQIIILPGSMGTASYLLLGAKGVEKTFYSVAHGAGRVMSRSKAKRQIWGQDLIRELNQKGIIAKAHSLPGLAEEAPFAYKDIDEVAKVMERVNLGRPIVKLKPLGVIKG